MYEGQTDWFTSSRYITQTRWRDDLEWTGVDSSALLQELVPLMRHLALLKQAKTLEAALAGGGVGADRLMEWKTVLSNALYERDGDASETALRRCGFYGLWSHRGCISTV